MKHTKNFLLVIIPKDDQSDLIEVNKSSFYEHWEDATEAYNAMIADQGGEAGKIPKTPQVLSYEATHHYIQLWECNLPIINN